MDLVKKLLMKKQGASPPPTAQAVDFDGTNDFLTRSSDLIGNVDGTKFTCSVWVYVNSINGNYCSVYTMGSMNNGTYGWTMYISPTGFFGVAVRISSGGTVLLDMTSSAAIPLKTFTHYLCSVDLTNTSNRSLYINDVADSPTWTTYSNSLGKFSGSNQVSMIGSSGTATATGPNGRFSNIYVDYIYRDFSIVANRRLFTTSDLYPSSINVSSTGDPYWNYVVALLHLDGANGSTTFTDETGRHTFSTPGSAAISTSQSEFGGASLAPANANNGWITTSPSTDWQLASGDLTIEAWIYVTSFASARSASMNIMSAASVAGDWAFGCYATSFPGALTVSLVNIGEIRSANNVVSANTWHHVAVTRLGTRIDVWCDGTSVANGTTNEFNNSTSNFFVGGHTWNTGESFVGFIDEVRVTKGVARYTATFTPTGPFSSSLPSGDPYVNSVGTLLHFDGTSGATTFTESAPNANSHTITSNGGAALSNTQAMFGSTSLRSNPTGSQYVTVSADSNFAFGTGDFTAEAWGYLLTTGADRILFDTRNISAGGGGVSILYQQSSGKWCYVGPNNGVLIVSSATATTGQWNHFAITRLGTTVNCWLNGALVATATDSNSSTNNVLQIGSGTQGTAFSVYWDGYIDEVRFTKGIARYTTTFVPIGPFSAVAQTYPIVYMPLASGSTSNTNNGFGGSLVQNGTPATSSRGPNQYNTKMNNITTTSGWIKNTSFGFTDGKIATFIISFRANVVNSTEYGLFSMGDVGGIYFRLFISSSNILTLIGSTSGPTTQLQASYNTAIVANRNYNVTISFDMSNSAKRSFIVNGVTNAVTWTTYNNSNIHFAGGTTGAFPSEGSTSNTLNGSIGDLYLDNTYFDLTTTINQAKVYTGTGIDCKPVDMGITGSNLSGSSPILFFRNDANNAIKNFGTGGNWTLNGSAPVGSRSISEYWGNQIGTFNNSNFLNAASLSGITDNKTFTISCWVKFAAFNTSGNILLEFATGTGGVTNMRFFIAQDFNGGGGWQVQAANSSNSTILSANSGVVASTGVVYNFLMSVDLSNSSKRSFYINGSPVSMTWITYTNDIINLASNNCCIGKTARVGSVMTNGNLGEIWFDNSYIDLTVATNRQKFIDKFGEPVSLGSTGAIPTGTSPKLYMRFDPSSITTNSGTGGNFTTTGTLTDQGQF